MEALVAQLNARLTQPEEMANLGTNAANLPLVTMTTTSAAQIEQINRELERTKAIAEKVITDNMKAPAFKVKLATPMAGFLLVNLIFRGFGSKFL